MAVAADAAAVVVVVLVALRDYLTTATMKKSKAMTRLKGNFEMNAFVDAAGCCCCWTSPL